MSRDRYTVFRQNYPHFVTLTYTKWLALNSDTAVVEIVLSAIRYHQSENHLIIYGWVCMENHFHILLKSPNLSKSIHSIKSYSAKKIIEYLKMRGRKSLLNDLYWGKSYHKTSQDFQVWRDGFHPVEITSRKTMLVKLEYIHTNPLRRGYVREAKDWRYSSMGSYLGYDDELLEVCTRW